MRSRSSSFTFQALLPLPALSIYPAVNLSRKNLGNGDDCIDNESYCCSWTKSTCGLVEWCDQSEANCLGNCNGEWINPNDYFPKEDHCCSCDQYSSIAVRM